VPQWSVPVRVISVRGEDISRLYRFDRVSIIGFVWVCFFLGCLFLGCERGKLGLFCIIKKGRSGEIAFGDDIIHLRGIVFDLVFSLLFCIPLTLSQPVLYHKWLECQDISVAFVDIFRKLGDGLTVGQFSVL